MTSAFVEALGKPTAERWTSVLFGPATLFWAVGLLMWMLGESSWDQSGQRLLDWFGRLSSGEQIVVAMGALLVFTALDAFVRRFSFPALQLLEGYGVLMRVRPLTRYQAARLAKANAELDAFLKGPDLSSLPPEELDRYSTVAERVRRSPASAAFLMPTGLGNILRAAETWPRDKYGLDAVICWPRLSLLLDDAAKGEIAKAEQGLDDAVVLFIWGALAFLAWSIVFQDALVILVTLLIATSVCTFAYWWAKQRARIFADLVEATFDVHRGKLYDALRVKKPNKSSDEPQLGEKITGFLWWRESQKSPELDYVEDESRKADDSAKTL